MKDCIQYPAVPEKGVFLRGIGRMCLKQKQCRSDQIFMLERMCLHLIHKALHTKGSREAVIVKQACLIGRRNQASRWDSGYSLHTARHKRSCRHFRRNLMNRMVFGLAAACIGLAIGGCSNPGSSGGSAPAAGGEGTSQPATPPAATPAPAATANAPAASHTAMTPPASGGTAQQPAAASTASSH